MQPVQCGTNDAVPQPSGATLTLFVHVETQYFDEQYLGQLGQDTGPARPR